MRRVTKATAGLRVLFATFFIAAYAVPAWAAATFNEIKGAYQPSDTQILDRHGELLHRLRTDATVRRGQWVALADVSPALRTALVLSEDKRFYEHSGVDWRAVSAAAWGNLWNTKTRGASTITMQLAGLLDDDLKRGAGGRSVVQKLGQTVSATVLENSWRKDQILEAYLNLVPFRGELVGIDALSHTLFGKAAHGLNNHEAAVAVALVRAPNAKAAQVVQRACSVLQSLEKTSADDCGAMDLFVSGALQRRDFAASVGIAPHVASQLARAAPAGTRQITTTLSAPLQRFAVQTLQTHLRELAGRHVEDAALVVLDNASGEVLAWVGSSGPLSSAADVDGVTALRQPGSTLKPFLYAQAIAERRITAAFPSGRLRHANPDRWRPLHSAELRPPVQGLGVSSHRIGRVAQCACRAHAGDGVARCLPQTTGPHLGLPLKESGDFYGYSLALGSAEVPLLHLTNAYRALANGGTTSPTTLIQVTRPLTKTAALDPGAAFIVGDILSDPLARARTFGTDSVLATRFWTAVKTGTSKDMRDNWALGWSQRYTVGVWVGNASGAPMWDVSGTTGAAPIWAAVMNYLHARQPSRPPKAPPGVVQARVQFANAAGSSEAARSEWFMAGTQQPTFAMNSGAGYANSTGATARIVSPTNGTIIALDPDIPPNRQRLTLQAEGTNLRWVMDGKPLAQGNRTLWLPWPGRHVLQITDAKGKELDAVRFDVRGAGVKAAR